MARGCWSIIGNSGIGRYPTSCNACRKRNYRLGTSQSRRERPCSNSVPIARACRSENNLRENSRRDPFGLPYHKLQNQADLGCVGVYNARDRGFRTSYDGRSLGQPRNGRRANRRQHNHLGICCGTCRWRGGGSRVPRCHYESP